MYPREIPLLRVLAPFALGIAGSAWLESASPLLVWLPPVFAAFLLLFSLFRYEYSHRWVYGVVHAGFFAVTGLVLAIYHNELLQEEHFSKVASAGQSSWLVAQLTEPPLVEGRVTVVAKVQHIGVHPDSMLPCSGNLQLRLDTVLETKDLRYGDLICVCARVAPVRGPQNPFSFDYRKYLHFQNIHYQGYVKETPIRLLARDRGNKVWKMAYGARERLLLLLKRYFPGNAEYAVVSALLIGYKEDLDDSLRSAYVDTGSMHALAVSGSHVAMIYMGLILGIGRIPGFWRGRRYVELVLILGVIWSFAFLTGASASVMRATVMFTFYLTGKTMHRSANPFNVLGASAFFLLLINPWFLFDPGFQLSYAAVVGMVYFYPKWLKRSPVFPSWADWAWKLVLVSFSAQLTTLPISLYYFHAMPVLFWASGLIVVPVGGFVLGAGFLLTVSDDIASVLASLVGKVLCGTVWLMNKSITVLQSVPYSTIKGIWIDQSTVLVLYLILILTAVAFEKRSGYWINLAMGCLLGLTCLGTWERLNEQRQQKLVVYQIPKAFQMDLFMGETAYTLVIDSISEKTEQFSIQPCRDAHAIRDVQTLTIEGAPPRLHAGSCTLLLICGPLDPDTVAEASADVLLLDRFSKGSLELLLDKSGAREVVCTANNYPKSVAAWDSECRLRGVSFHNLYARGAWEKNLDP